MHQFEKTRAGWRERLVDEASADSPLHLRLVLANRPTAASHLLVPERLEGLDPDVREAIASLEVCPQGMALAQTLAARLRRPSDGAALLIDYGRDGPYGASLQAIRGHDFVSVLERPGEADLSAWVDFDALRLAVDRSPSASSAEVLGPVSQAHFLLALGLEARVQALLNAAETEEEMEQIVQAATRLVAGEPEGGGVDGMGQTYQAIAIVPKAAPTPVPFERETEEQRKQRKHAERMQRMERTRAREQESRTNRRSEGHGIVGEGNGGGMAQRPHAHARHTSDNGSGTDAQVHAAAHPEDALPMRPLSRTTWGVAPPGGLETERPPPPRRVLDPAGRPAEESAGKENQTATTPKRTTYDARGRGKGGEKGGA